MTFYRLLLLLLLRCAVGGDIHGGVGVRALGLPVVGLVGIWLGLLLRGVGGDVLGRLAVLRAVVIIRGRTDGGILLLRGLAILRAAVRGWLSVLRGVGVVGVGVLRLAILRRELRGCLCLALAVTSESDVKRCCGPGQGLAR